MRCGLIGGGTVISRPSPPHPSCGSAMGGSQKSSGLNRIMDLNPQCANRDKPLFFEKRLGQPHVRGQCFRKMRVALSTQYCQDRLIPGRTKFDQLPDTPSCPAPLFPVTHADTPA